MAKESSRDCEKLLPVGWIKQQPEFVTSAVCKERLLPEANMNIYFIGMMDIPKIILDYFCCPVPWAS